MEITLLTPMLTLTEQLKTIERAGRTCYQSYRGKTITLVSARKFIRMILKRGHESVIEHSSMTVRFSGVSRGLTHELVRHRLCAFSQESTRYVDEKGFEMTLPPGRDKEDVLRGYGPGETTVGDIIAMYQDTYKTLRHNGWVPEDARQFLPIGMKNEIVVTANFREWRHIFRMRTTRPAHWEIRGVMAGLLEQIKEPLSPIFDSFQFVGDCPKGVPFYQED